MSVFVGTTNENEYLRDSTGARRFWPIKIGSINLPLIEANRDQLFAEAVHLYKSGAKWWEMPTSTALEQESRRQADVWEEVITTYLLGKMDVSVLEVGTDCLKLLPKEFKKPEEMRIAKCLRVLGWFNKDVWWNGKSVKRWFLKDEALPPSG